MGTCPIIRGFVGLEKGFFYQPSLVSPQFVPSRDARDDWIGDLGVVILRMSSSLPLEDFEYVRDLLDKDIIGTAGSVAERIRSKAR